MGEVMSAFTSVGTLLGGIGAVGGLLKKTPKPAEIPTPKEPAVAPAPDDEAAAAARRRQVAAIRARSGRESTFLSDIAGDGKLGAA